MELPQIVFCLMETHAKYCTTASMLHVFLVPPAHIPVKLRWQNQNFWFGTEGSTGIASTACCRPTWRYIRVKLFPVSSTFAAR